MLACPRNVVRAFALTPAAITRLAKVWRHSCKAIGFNPAVHQSNDWIVRAGRAEGLGTDGILDLVVLGAAAWEALCGVVEARQVSPAAVIVAWKRAATDADFLDVLDSQFGGSLVPGYLARSSDRAFEQWSRELGMSMPA